MPPTNKSNKKDNGNTNSASIKKQKRASASKEVVLVKNLPQTITQKKIREVFAKCNPVGIQFARKSNETSAYVSFRFPSSLKRALKLDGTSIDDKEISVVKYKMRSVKDVVEEPNTILVANLDPSVTEDKLSAFFSTCGKITKVHQPNFGKSKTHTARITFQDESSLESALKLSGEQLSKNLIHVESIDKKMEYDVMISRIDYQVKQNQLSKLLTKCGEVSDLYMPTIKNTGLNLGTAYVKFVNQKDKSKSLELDGTKLNDKPIMVKLLKPKKETKEEEEDAGDEQAEDKFIDDEAQEESESEDSGYESDINEDVSEEE
ncbi:RNA-binding protein [Acrasis kona]|uniref:RNA-binding protein n=1 Tax=Acrasis kona TaxID=1008807 RepID=A0AAW2ZAY2_9EUKA